jgi:hypothetical protein
MTADRGSCCYFLVYCICALSGRGLLLQNAGLDIKNKLTDKASLYKNQSLLLSVVFVVIFEQSDGKRHF